MQTQTKARLLKQPTTSKQALCFPAASSWGSSQGHPAHSWHAALGSGVELLAQIKAAYMWPFFANRCCMSVDSMAACSRAS